MTSERLVTNYCEIENWKNFCACFCYGPNILLRSTIYHAQNRLCSSTLKRNKSKVYISLKGNKLTCFAKKLRLFSGGARFFVVAHAWTKRLNKAYKKMRSEISDLTLKIPSCELVVLIDLNTYILTEGRNFNNFSRKLLFIY